MSVLPTVNVNVNYERQKEVIRSFLVDFRPERDPSEDALMLDGDEDEPPKYMSLLQKVANREEEIVTLELDDLFHYERDKKTSGTKMIVDYITENTSHYLDMVSSVIDEAIPESTNNFSYRDEVLDVILHHRLERNRRIREEMAQSDPLSQMSDAGAAVSSGLDSEMFPPELTRRYTLYFKPLTPTVRYPPNSPLAKKGKGLAVRDVKAEHLGKLITVRGVVTRVSDVKPAVVVTAYTCDKCGNEVFQEVKSRQFTPLLECPSQECVSNNSKGQLFPSTRASKFLAFQDVRIQELADQVPVGHIPRALTMHLKGPLVRSITPGDLVDISGIFMPRPYSGFRALKAGLLTDTYLDVQYIHPHKQQYHLVDLNARVREQIDEIRTSPNVYERLANSIAPEIWGHLDVKKALLLLLIGGVTKEIGDGMRIRGDINICLMGDPGVAKSQLLKFITKVAPRGVYTTGRGSSGVGLTAAVVRDPVTDEMILEGGALVLADNGVCCIDEFDKMDEMDRTAIHEVMEQQTISISKAGLSTTLNARSSILAAANPVYGRYNPNVSPMDNINLPAALLSRFDLLFLILDKPSRDNDLTLAEHVTYVHMHSQAPPMAFEPLSPELIRQYISMARQYRPTFPREVADFAASSYVQLRQRQKKESDEGKHFGHTTPRALLGVMRMAQALARLRFSDTVSQEDVDEALRLSEVSKHSLRYDNVDEGDVTASSKIYRIIVEIFRNHGSDSVPMTEVRQRVYAKGFTQQELQFCINQYQEMSVLLLTQDDQLMLV